MSKKSFKSQLEETPIKGLYNFIITSRNFGVDTKKFLSEHKEDQIAATLACDAARNSNRTFLEFLVHEGVSLNVVETSTNQNALSYAREKDNSSIIDYIIENPDVDIVGQ